jgi:hypothetical protein
MVASFKLKRSTSLLGIAFLSGLNNLQIELDMVDYLLSHSDKVGAKDRPLARLNPVHRCTTSAAIQCFESCHLETLLIVIVVRELNQQQTLVSFVLIVQHTNSEHIFKNMVHSLRLTIDMLMVC